MSSVPSITNRGARTFDGGLNMSLSEYEELIVKNKQLKADIAMLNHTIHCYKVEQPVTYRDLISLLEQLKEDYDKITSTQREGRTIPPLLIEKLLNNAKRYMETF